MSKVPERSLHTDDKNAKAATGYVPFTLCEPGFAAGAAALFNSLNEAGFDGTFIIGLKGAPCRWMRAVPKLPSGSANFRIVEVDTDRHLTHAKARFATRILDELCPRCAGVVYFDPDIIVKARWTEIVEHVRAACAVCADASSPGWKESGDAWVAFAQQVSGRKPELDGLCCNAGFVGVSRPFRRVFELWEQLIDACIKNGFDARCFTWDNEHPLPFFFVDQDMLNIAIRLAGVPVWIGGPETMDFAPGGRWVSHAITTPKPWDRWYLPRALAGRTIRACDIAFWENASAPIPALPAPLRWLHQLDLALARRVASGNPR